MGARPRRSRRRAETAPPAGSDGQDIWTARMPDASGTTPTKRQAQTRAHHAVAFTPPHSGRPRVALDLSPVHDAAAVGIECIAPMHGAAIVPQHEIAHAPDMLPTELAAIDDAPQLVEQRLGLGNLEPDQIGIAAATEIEHAAAARRMG